MRFIGQFIQDMERTLNAEAKNRSIAETWKTNPPKDAGGQSVQAYLRDVSTLNRIDVTVTLLLKCSRWEPTPLSTTFTTPWTNFGQHMRANLTDIPTLTQSPDTDGEKTEGLIPSSLKSVADHVVRSN